MTEDLYRLFDKLLRELAYELGHKLTQAELDGFNDLILTYGRERPVIAISELIESSPAVFPTPDTLRDKIELQVN